MEALDYHIANCKIGPWSWVVDIVICLGGGQCVLNNRSIRVSKTHFT